MSILAINPVRGAYVTSREVLPTHDGPQPPLGTTATALVRVAVQLAALFLGLRSILAAWRAAEGGSESKVKQDCKKDDDLVLHLARVATLCKVRKSIKVRD